MFGDLLNEILLATQAWLLSMPTFGYSSIMAYLKILTETVSIQVSFKATELCKITKGIASR